MLRGLSIVVGIFGLLGFVFSADMAFGLGKAGMMLSIAIIVLAIAVWVINTTLNQIKK